MYDLKNKHYLKPESIVNSFKVVNNTQFMHKSLAHCSIYSEISIKVWKRNLTLQALNFIHL